MYPTFISKRIHMSASPNGAVTDHLLAGWLFPKAYPKALITLGSTNIEVENQWFRKMICRCRFFRIYPLVI